MADQYGSDFISITHEDGTQYELEVLTRVEFNGSQYLAVISAEEEDSAVPSIVILKAVDENGEEILCTIEDAQELEAVDQLIMDQLYSEAE